jgi:hypothetical protein
VDVHIFTEKDAISGVVSPVTERWDVPLGVLRGYTSESFAHSVAEAIASCGKRTVYVYQLGDHDPSGADAWRAFRESVAGFLYAHPFAVEDGQHTYAFIGTDDRVARVTFARLAVTEDQIVEWELPTRPTKKSDTRARKFIGDSVEVDAIPAPVLRQLVENAIVGHIDVEALRLTQVAERSERDVLQRMAGGAA